MFKIVYRLELSRFSVCSINACGLPFYFYLFIYFLFADYYMRTRERPGRVWRETFEETYKRTTICLRGKIQIQFCRAARKGGGTNGPVDQIGVSGADYTRPCILFWARALFARGKRK